MINKLLFPILQLTVLLVFGPVITLATLADLKAQSKPITWSNFKQAWYCNFNWDDDSDDDHRINNLK